MTAPRRLPPEALLTLLVLAGVAWTMARFANDAMLPQPFVFDAKDTFMDWFNTAWWAHNPGAYDKWLSVYPPVSFIFLRLFSSSRCYAGDPFAARDCDLIGIATILFCYALTVALAALAFRRNDRGTAIWRGVSFALGLPLLFALERGNLILVCLPPFILAYGGLVRAGWFRALCAAATINLKPYLLVPLAAWALRRSWRRIELAALFAILLYLATYFLFGSGDPGQIASNSIGFSMLRKSIVWEQGLYSTSLAPLRDFQADLAPGHGWAFATIPWLIDATRLLTLACLLGALLYPRALTGARLALLLFGTYIAGQTPGGYTQTFLIFLVFLERWERPGPVIALVAGYLLSIPYDHLLWEMLHYPSVSWLAGGRPLEHRFGVSIGMFARPALILVLLWSLAIDSLALILRGRRGATARVPAPVAA